MQQKATGPASGAFSQGRQANLSIESDFLVDGLAGRLKRLACFFVEQAADEFRTGLPLSFVRLCAEGH